MFHSLNLCRKSKHCRGYEEEEGDLLSLVPTVQPSSSAGPEPSVGIAVYSTPGEWLCYSIFFPMYNSNNNNNMCIMYGIKLNIGLLASIRMVLRVFWPKIEWIHVSIRWWTMLVGTMRSAKWSDGFYLKITASALPLFITFYFLTGWLTHRGPWGYVEEKRHYTSGRTFFLYVDPALDFLVDLSGSIHTKPNHNQQKLGFRENIGYNFSVYFDRYNVKLSRIWEIYTVPIYMLNLMLFKLPICKSWWTRFIYLPSIMDRNLS